MTKRVGRSLLLELAVEIPPANPGDDPTEQYQTMASLNTKSMTINNTGIDSTTPAPATPEGKLHRQSLAGMKSVDLSGDGIFVSTEMQSRFETAAFADNPVAKLRIHLPASTQHVGEFRITSYERGGETEGATTFSLTLESIGWIGQLIDHEASLVKLGDRATADKNLTAITSNNDLIQFAYSQGNTLSPVVNDAWLLETPDFRPSSARLTGITLDDQRGALGTISLFFDTADGQDTALAPLIATECFFKIRIISDGYEWIGTANPDDVAFDAIAISHNVSNNSLATTINRLNGRITNNNLNPGNVEFEIRFTLPI